MQHVKTMFNHAKGLPALPLAGALLLFLTPFFGIAYDAAMASAIIIGGTALMLWGKVALSPEAMDYWLMAVIGGIALFAPWILGFGAFSSWAFLTHLMAGVAIFGVAAYELIKLRERQKPRSPAQPG